MKLKSFKKMFNRFLSRTFGAERLVRKFEFQLIDDWEDQRLNRRSFCDEIKLSGVRHKLVWTSPFHRHVKVTQEVGNLVDLYYRSPKKYAGMDLNEFLRRSVSKSE